MTHTVVHIIDEDEASVSKLLEAAGGPQLDHTVAQLRQDREAAKARAEAAESFATQGYRVLDERPAWRDTNYVELRWLRTPEGQQITEEAISNPRAGPFGSMRKSTTSTANRANR